MTSRSLIFGFLLATFFLAGLSHSEAIEGDSIKASMISQEISTTSLGNRKLLTTTPSLSPEQGVEEVVAEEGGEKVKCSREDIDIYEGQTDPLPNGIPTYSVNIVNVCSTGCSISNIHLSCGWFSSARLINPKVFRRLSHDDCLVNNGGPLAHGQSISFVYANTFRYPLTVSSLTC
ncbi:TPD1 protein homolog 1-like [Macadamia integrifolia]|uniref:TPD1 protein homolog 1-like n=1 Tax=Macadamia integrifolia TaxID=60698 RepID=UPI001C52B8D5|nr:TPD1 protein homolog 1-like [Macadamia integrifolia]